MSKILTYTELSRLKTFEERFAYLKLSGMVGAETFGYDRILNQRFYNSAEWRQFRNHIIVRDNGCDLGVEGHDILVRPIIHHIIPLSVDDILNRSDLLMNPEYVITTTHETHQAIHYGTEPAKPSVILRTPNDTCPWRM